MPLPHGSRRIVDDKGFLIGDDSVMTKNNSKHLQAFSLFEISIALTVMGLMAGAAIEMLNESMSSKGAETTVARMDDIEEAMVAFRLANKRLPCPASMSATINTASYGAEAATPGTCTGLSGDGSNAVYGSVPVKALGLDDMAAFDGWDRRIVYHVDKRMTGTTATDTYASDDTTVGIFTVKDGAAAPTDRTTKAVYVLASSGGNGHGSYGMGGTQRRSVGSTNTHELENCDCTSAGIAAAYNLDFYQHQRTENAASVLDTFDDQVRYRLRSQLDTVVSGGSGGGGTISPDTLDFTEFKDAMALDASTDVAADGAEVFSLSNTGTGHSFLVNDQAADTTPFVINASGNVGIGTTAPARLLEVSSSTDTALMRLTYGSYSRDFSISANNNFTLSGTTTTAAGSYNSAQMTFDSGVTGGGYGFFGQAYVIGSAAPSTATGVMGRGYQSGSGTVTWLTGVQAQNYVWGAAATGNVTNAVALSIPDTVYGGGATSAITNSYGIYLNNRTIGTNQWGMYQAGTDNNYFAGNIGIGDATPTEKLSIDLNSSVGGVVINNNGGTTDAYTGYIDYSHIAWYNGIVGNSGGYHIRSSGSTWAAGTDRFAISHAGYVGIGSGGAASGYQLYVKSSNAADWTGLFSSQSSLTHAYLAHNNYGMHATTTGASAISMYGHATGTGAIASYNLATSAGGHALLAQNTSSSYYCYIGYLNTYSIVCSGPTSGVSDGRLKKDVVPLKYDEGLASVMALRPVHYRWKDPRKSGHTELGFIAQEVEAAIPGLVSTITNDDKVRQKGEPRKIKVLNYERIIVPVVKAVQQLAEWMERIEVRMEALAENVQQRLNQHSAKIAALEAQVERQDALIQKLLTSVSAEKPVAKQMPHPQHP
jgi:Chaperone of endosialidase